MPATDSPRPDTAKETSTSHDEYADDYIYPVHLLDGAKYQHCILTLLLRFNDKLDPQKIKEALSKLLEIGDWKKLGGRFRTKGGRLEIHVPNQYTATRPAFGFAHQVFDSSIVEHPFGCQFPHTDDGVSLSPPLDDLRLCGHAPDFPITMADLIDRDAPQLYFKMISYTDATIFATTFSHCTWDISGIQGFMKSLQLVLDGREDEVPPMLGASTDILAELASQYEGCLLDDELLEVPGEKMEMEEPSLPNPALEERLIRVPLDIYQRLRSRSAHEYPMEDKDTSMAYQPDELLMALIVQQVARAQPVPRPLKLLSILNARLVVPCIAKASGIYAQNLVLLAPQTLHHDIATGPMGPIVLSQRQSFAQSVMPENMARSIQIILAAIQAGVNITALSGSGDAKPLLMNNLIRLSSFIDVDLSSAVVSQGEDSATRRNGLGTADFCYLTVPHNSYGIMRATTLGSYNGNACWIFGELPSRAWELLYEALDELQL